MLLWSPAPRLTPSAHPHREIALTRSSACAAARPHPSELELVVDPAASAVHYRLRHALHRVLGTSRAVQGKAIVSEDGGVRVGAFAPVASFRSGDEDRDARVREVLAGQGRAFVVFKGEGRLPAWPATGPLELAVNGEVTLNGVARPATVHLQLTFAADGTARARARFELSLEAHRVARPALLLVKVDDRCLVEVDLLARPARR